MLARIISRLGYANVGCCVLICVLSALFAAGPAAATGSTRYVSSSGDDTDNDCTDALNPCLTVQHAIDQASAGDTVAVAGVHDETVLVLRSITIVQWPGAASAVLDGTNTNTGDPMLWVDGADALVPPAVTLSGLSIENGASNDGILVTGAASLTVADATISQNAGNGLRVESDSTATVENSALTNNGGSGLVVQSNSTATVQNSAISYNSDAGILADAGNTVTVENSTIANNSGSGVYDAGTATILRSTIKGNISSAGAGIGVDSGGTLLVGESTLTGNSSVNPGAALLNLGTATVENSTIAHNSSAGGSAIATLNNASVTLAGDIVAEQTSGSDCRGIASIVDDGYNLDDDGSCISKTSPGKGSHNGRTADGSSTYGAVLDAYLANSLASNGGPTPTLGLLNHPGPGTKERNPALAVVPASFHLPAAIHAKSAACTVPDQRGVTPAAGIRCDVGAYLLQATRTALATSRRIVHTGVAVTYTATITPAPDGGTVAISDGAGHPATMHCHARPLTGGKASCTVSYHTAGAFSVTAKYSGDGKSNDYAGSASRPPLRQIVSTPVPRLSALQVQPHRFRAATGATVTYRDTLAAHTTLRVYRKLRGVKQGSECVTAPKGKHPRKGKPCTRLVPVGAFMHDDKAGSNHLHFTGRLGGHALRPGSYELRATAKLDGRHSHTISGSFVISAPRP